MLEKIKVMISQEDGTPVCPMMLETDTIFLTDEFPFLTVKKDGGTIETVSGDISVFLEFAARQLANLSVMKRREVSETIGLEFHRTSKI